jgi:hypothetical protein
MATAGKPLLVGAKEEITKREDAQPSCRHPLRQPTCWGLPLRPASQTARDSPLPECAQLLWAGGLNLQVRDRQVLGGRDGGKTCRLALGPARQTARDTQLRECAQLLWVGRPNLQEPDERAIDSPRNKTKRKSINTHVFVFAFVFLEGCEEFRTCRHNCGTTRV